MRLGNAPATACPPRELTLFFFRFMRGCADSTCSCPLLTSAWIAVYRERSTALLEHLEKSNAGLFHVMVSVRVVARPRRLRVGGTVDELLRVVPTSP